MFWEPTLCVSGTRKFSGDPFPLGTCSVGFGFTGEGVGSYTRYGAFGEHGDRLWGREAFDWAVPLAVAHNLDPNAFLLCLGHAGVACLGGPAIVGDPANPSPTSLYLAHIGQDSVGKTRNTNFIRHLLAKVEERGISAAPPRGEQQVCGRP